LAWYSRAAVFRSDILAFRFYCWTDWSARIRASQNPHKT